MTIARKSHRWPFRKMHGAGNDFVIFDGRADHLDLSRAQLRHIADRHYGIGCDQVITLGRSGGADIFMTIHNADGSEVNACGNATRCVGAILMQEMGRDSVTIETGAGMLKAMRDGEMVRVDMGVPKRQWQEIPLAQDMDTDDLDFAIGPLSHPVAVNMGNPHIVFFVRKLEDISLSELGPQIENHALFPEGVNVSIVEDCKRGHLRARVWERGAGLTMACGTAACAALVAASIRGIVNRTATLEMDGGRLHMQWDDQDHVQMTGPVSYVYDGQISLDQIS